MLQLCLLVAFGSDMIGYYSWNWGTGSEGSKGATDAVAFTGLVDVATAISGYPRTGSHPWCCPPLKGTAWISLGGGNAAGQFTATNLQAATTVNSTNAIKAAGYGGVMFDAEEVIGDAASVVGAFKAAFAACKSAGLKVGVTTSHSAPYATDTPEVAVALVKAWAVDPNVDVLSPQLYSSGQESSPEFDETSACKVAGCTWDLYKPFKGVFAPSIVDASQLSAVQTYFAGNNLSLNRAKCQRKEAREIEHSKMN
eukprot:gene4956-4683_t